MNMSGLEKKTTMNNDVMLLLIKQVGDFTRFFVLTTKIAEPHFSKYLTKYMKNLQPNKAQHPQAQPTKMLLVGTYGTLLGSSGGRSIRSGSNGFPLEDGESSIFLTDPQMGLLV